MSDNIQIKSKKISIVPPITDANKLPNLLLLLAEANRKNYTIDVHGLKTYVNQEILEMIYDIQDNIDEISNKQDEFQNQIEDIGNNYDDLLDILDDQVSLISELRTDLNTNISTDNARYEEFLDHLRNGDEINTTELQNLLSMILSNTSYSITYNTTTNYSLKIDGVEKPNSVKYGNHTLQIQPNDGYYINKLTINSDVINNVNDDITISVSKEMNINVDVKPYTYKISFQTSNNYIHCNVNTDYFTTVMMGSSTVIPINELYIDPHYKISSIQFLGDHGTYCSYIITNDGIRITPNGKGTLVGDYIPIKITGITCTGNDAFILFDSSYYDNILNSGKFTNNVNCKIYESNNNYPIIPNQLYSLNDVPYNTTRGELYCAVKRSLIDNSRIGTDYKWLNINGTYYEYVYEGSLSGTHTNIELPTDINIQYNGYDLSIIKLWWDESSYYNKQFKFI